MASSIPPAKPYSWPHDSSLSPETTALVIIDMQRDFLDPYGYYASCGLDVSAGQAIIPRVKELLGSARNAGLQVYWTREGHREDLSTLPSRERARSKLAGAGIGSQGPLGRALVRGQPGWEIVPELQPKSNEPIIDKPMRSAFAHTDFSLLIQIRGIKNLILTGVVTDVRVLSTMKDACDNGLDCLLVKDACAAASQDVHDAVVKSVETEGGIVGATATVREVNEVLIGLKAKAEEKKGIDMVEEIMRMAR